MFNEFFALFMNNFNRFIRYSKIDQVNLLQLIARWEQQNPDDHFHFTPASNIPTDDGLRGANVDLITQDDDDEVCPQMQGTQERTSFFFCHQTKFQRHLLRR